MVKVSETTVITSSDEEQVSIAREILHEFGKDINEGKSSAIVIGMLDNKNGYRRANVINRNVEALSAVGLALLIQSDLLDAVKHAEHDQVALEDAVPASLQTH